MKKIQYWRPCRTLFLSLLALITLMTSHQAKANVHGDDYPLAWKKGAGSDRWGMILRQCTSFVAHRLEKVNGFTLPIGYGNADTWGHIARRQGYRVDNQPAVGSVAWFDKGVNNSHALYGHVSWVAKVNGDYVTLEEYNFNAGQGPEKYHFRKIHRNQASGFIHFKDMGSSHGLSATTSTNIADKGIYYFTEAEPVKVSPQLSSQTLIHYQKGQNVHYDQKFTSDGYEWLSYIGQSGNRRYIPITKLEENIFSPLKVGDKVAFQGSFRVTGIHGSLISSERLAGGQPGQLNWLDPEPVNESTAEGQTSGDQQLHVGEYFTIPGTYTIIGIDQATNGALIQIGNRATWVTQGVIRRS